MSKKQTLKARLNQRKVHFTQAKNALTSQAGLIPAFRFLNHFGLPDILDKRINIERGPNATFQLTDIILLVTTGILAGARSLMKVCTVWQDQILRECTGFQRIPCDSQFGRLLRLCRFATVVELEAAVHQMRGRVWKKALRSGKSTVYALKRITIDLDSTVKTCFGFQEGAKKGFNEKKRGALSYHPQLAFCVETKELLQGWLRSGDAYTANGSVEFMKQLLVTLPSHMKIFFRADSGYFGGPLLSYLEDLGHRYLVKVKLKNLNKLLIPQHWKPVVRQPGWEWCEFQHRCGGWDRERRFVAVRQIKASKAESAQGELLDPKSEYDYFCYVTTESLSPWEIHKAYGKRATCETWIEENKNQMALGQIKTADFMANSALMQCAILAYNTTRWMAMLSGNRQLMKWEPESVRCYMIRVAGKLLTGSRQLTVASNKEHLYQTEWDAWLAMGDCL